MRLSASWREFVRKGLKSCELRGMLLKDSFQQFVYMFVEGGYIHRALQWMNRRCGKFHTLILLIVLSST